MKYLCMLVWAAALGGLVGACRVEFDPSAEGETCALWDRCEEGLACVPGVGADYGHEPTDAVCERPRGIYGFLTFGERGDNSRVDEALDMINGVYRLPRMLEGEPDLAVLAHPMVAADGEALRCHDVAAGAGAERDCLVPDWSAYYRLELTKYPRFILFGLRITGALFYTQHQASNTRLRERIARKTGRRPGQVGREEIERVRLDARNTALAIFDSFVTRGHFPFALGEMPACYAGASGYQNPNASWAPALAQWDPVTAISASGRLVTATDVPVECDGGLTYAEVRDSLWDRHATSYRALALSNGYYQFRGLLPAARRDAWLAAIRETGEALSLPSSYEAGDNHGITESAALLQLAEAFAGLLPQDHTDAWLELGRHRLNDLVGDTVFPNDGVQVEQSPFYHNYQLALLLEVAAWLDQVGIDLTAGIDPRYRTDPDAIPAAERLDYDAVAPAPTNPDVNGLDPSDTLDLRGTLEQMARAAVHIGQPDGWVPMIGSSLPQELRRYQEAVLGPYAAGDSESARRFLFYRSAGAEGTPPPDEERLLVFEDSGFVTMHSSFAPPFPMQTHLVFNAGLPYHGHSHADALAVHLYGPDPTPGAEVGLPLLVDPGWFSYRADGRHYFESTLAHNTIHVDGQNQCVRDARGKRRAPHVAEALASCEELRLANPGATSALLGQVARGLTARAEAANGRWAYQSAQHGLYAGVVHRRAVALLDQHIVIVVDQVSAEQPRDLAQSWHLSPQLARLANPPAIDGGTYRFAFSRGTGEPPLISLHQPDPSGALEVALHYGEPEIDGVPGRGWYSTAEDERQPHQVVELRRPGATNATFASVFLLGELAARRPAVTLSEPSPNEIAVQLTFEGAAAMSLRIENLAAGTPTETVRVQF